MISKTKILMFHSKTVVSTAFEAVLLIRGFNFFLIKRKSLLRSWGHKIFCSNLEKFVQVDGAIFVFVYFFDQLLHFVFRKRVAYFFEE